MKWNENEIDNWRIQRIEDMKKMNWWGLGGEDRHVIVGSFNALQTC